MNKIENKFAIGCLVQWYEIEIIEEYIESLKQSLKHLENSENVIVDFTLTTNQKLEQISDEIDINVIRFRFQDMMKDFDIDIQWRVTDELVTIADYRREFNDKYCEKVDVLMWGETDALLPKQTFVILDNLHNSVKDNTPKYTTFFGTCKMWDKSWEVLEHPDFTDKPFYSEPEDFKPDQWWSNRYTMKIDEMNKFNDKVENLDIRILNQHKFNGCGLVISSEVIKSGVNIPKSVFFVHEDTSFMIMIQKVLGMIPQYVVKNILLVHNRNHPKKRMYVKGEREDGTMNEKRRSNQWYVRANEMSEKNCYNLFNPNYKSFSWEDVWK
jgi:hypothetical protein